MKTVSIHTASISVGDRFEHFGHGHVIQIDAISFVEIEYLDKAWHRIEATLVADGTPFTTTAQHIYESFDRVS